MDDFQTKLENNPKITQNAIDKLEEHLADVVWDAAWKLYPNDENFEAFNESSEYELFLFHILDKFIEKVRKTPAIDKAEERVSS